MTEIKQVFQCDAPEFFSVINFGVIGVKIRDSCSNNFGVKL